MEKIFLVMPAYNEEANIDAVVKQWHAVAERLAEEGAEPVLLIANDGSRDSTWERLCKLRDEFPYLHPIDKPNSGHGATLLVLYRHALDNGADYIFQTDSDGQTDPKEFFPFWRERADYDLQVGLRASRQDGFSRKVVTKVLKAVVKMTFHVSVPDANTPFRLMKAESVRPVLDDIPEGFFLSNVALAAISVKKGLKTRWLPITFKPRQGGVNSINLPRIFRIGRKAVGDFRRLNSSIKK